MSFCPVCNGLTSIQVKCSHCQSQVDDLGRVGDFYGPYSPYRPIDDIKLTNGYTDIMNHECLHVLVCPACGQSAGHSVNEWKH